MKTQTSTSKRLNKAISNAYNYPEQLRYPKLDIVTLHIVEYSDAAFVNNYDLSLEQRPIIFLVDVDDNAESMACKSYKSRRVTRSFLAVELIGLADVFNEGF